MDSNQTISSLISLYYTLSNSFENLKQTLTSYFSKEENNNVWSLVDNVGDCINKFENALHNLGEQTKLDCIDQKLNYITDLLHEVVHGTSHEENIHSESQGLLTTSYSTLSPQNRDPSTPLELPQNSLNMKKISDIPRPYSKRLKQDEKINHLSYISDLSPNEELGLNGDLKSNEINIENKEFIANWLKKQVTNLKEHIRKNLKDENNKNDILNADFVLQMCQEASPELYYVLTQLYETKKKQRSQNIVVHILHQLLYLQSTHANWFATQLGIYINKKAPSLVQLLSSYGIITTKSKDWASPDLEKRLFNGIKHNETGNSRTNIGVSAQFSPSSSSNLSLSLSALNYPHLHSNLPTSHPYIHSTHSLPYSEDTEHGLLLPPQQQTSLHDPSPLPLNVSSPPFQSVFHPTQDLYSTEDPHPSESSIHSQKSYIMLSENCNHEDPSRTTDSNTHFDSYS